MNNKGQLTIFIIIAIVIVAGSVLFFVFREGVQPSTLNKEFQPVYSQFSTCLEEATRNGIDILESQGGWVYPPKFEAGSTYMPLSSQLDFLGNHIPYWYYVSENNVGREQVASKEEMQQQLSQFIAEKMIDCNFKNFYDQGFLIDYDKKNIKPGVVINDNSVDVSLTNYDFSVSDGQSSNVVKDHKISIDSSLGKFYNDAKKIYNLEQQTLFLENYSIDNLRLYAPVDGVEISCSPKIWKAQDVVSEIQNAVEANTLALKTGGNYYTLNKKEDKYFVIKDLGVDEKVQFLNSKNWPYKIDVTPSNGALLMAQPVGNQPGLGILGFCYAPYHFVYDVAYPVLIQLYNDKEVFQFPVAVVIKGNKPRNPVEGSNSVDIGLPELCDYKNTSVKVSVSDNHLNPIDADISFECFGTRCDIGKTQSGILTADYPVCINGFIRAQAGGYIDGKYLYSTNNPGELNIILDKKYELNVLLKKDGVISNDAATINFVSDKDSVTVIYPEQKKVSLSEGSYNVSVYSYGSTTIKLPDETKEQCIDIPSSGFGAIFGSTKKKCFDINIPGQDISQALNGGGKLSTYILESNLNTGVKNVEINFQSVKTPTSIDDIQTNYELVENHNLDLKFT